MIAGSVPFAKRTSGVRRLTASGVQPRRVRFGTSRYSLKVREGSSK